MSLKSVLSKWETFYDRSSFQVASFMLIKIKVPVKLNFAKVEKLETYIFHKLRIATLKFFVATQSEALTKGLFWPDNQVLHRTILITTHMGRFIGINPFTLNLDGDLATQDQVVARRPKPLRYGTADDD